MHDRLLAESLKCHGRPHLFALDREQALITAQAGGANPALDECPSQMTVSRAALRQHFRSQRNALSDRARLIAALKLCKQVQRLNCFRRARRIAAYHPSDGEIDVRPLMAAALARKKRVALPVVDRRSRPDMQFAEWSPGVPMRHNAYGILEPLRADRRLVAASALDLVLVPLVAFDESGNRLGMGGGYYDRRFAFLAQRSMQRPILVGVAYEFQKTDALENESWDVPLTWVVTERSVHRGKG